MSRSTLDDRNRKRRINQREFNRLRRQMNLIDNMSDAQEALLQKVADAEAKDSPLTPEDVPEWRELRKMGVLRARQGHLLMTAVGQDVLAGEDEE